MRFASLSSLSFLTASSASLRFSSASFAASGWSRRYFSSSHSLGSFGMRLASRYGSYARSFLSGSASRASRT